MRMLAYALLAVSACGAGVFAPVLSAQSQTQPQAGASQDQPDPAEVPLSPVEQRDQQIRQVDPLDRDDPDSKNKDKDKSRAARDAENRRAQDEAPIPGSIAASQQNSAKRSGPEVVEDDDGNPVQEYTGPAVLSRSYSINQALVPEQVKWQETVGVSAVYDSGVSKSYTGSGTIGPPSTLVGTQVKWGFAGRHYFHRDLVTVNYTGNVQKYSGIGAYNGWNQALSVTYSHYLTRHLILNSRGNGLDFCGELWFGKSASRTRNYRQHRYREQSEHPGLRRRRERVYNAGGPDVAEVQPPVV